MKQHTSKSMGRQQGFTLVELGISMVLIASMVLAGFYVVKRIRTDAAINAVIASASISMNQANASYAGMRRTVGANIDVLAAMNVWPKERHIITLNKSGTQVLSQTVSGIKGHFSGSKEMMFADNTGTGFIYHFYNIPTEACLPLVKNLALHPNALTIQVNKVISEPTATVVWGGLVSSAVKNGTGNLDMAAAAKQCTLANQVHMAVQFDKS
jgi:type II secretory pathway pseudopilin PulG